MRIILAILFAASVCVLPGCIIPIPHRTVLALGFQGKVIDSVSGEPVLAVVKVESSKSDLTRRCDSQGVYSIPTEYQWHGAILFAVALNHSIFPFVGHTRDRYSRSLHISAPGYIDKQVIATHFPDSVPEGQTSIKVTGIQAEPIQLRRLSSLQPKKRSAPP